MFCRRSFPIDLYDTNPLTALPLRMTERTTKKAVATTVKIKWCGNWGIFCSSRRTSILRALHHTINSIAWDSCHAQPRHRIDVNHLCSKARANLCISCWFDVNHEKHKRRRRATHKFQWNRQSSNRQCESNNFIYVRRSKFLWNEWTSSKKRERSEKTHIKPFPTFLSVFAVVPSARRRTSYVRAQELKWTKRVFFFFVAFILP